MNTYDCSLDAETLADEDNVVMFRPRQPSPKRIERDVPETFAFGTQRFPVDVRGDVTFGRLMSGLSTVGLTVRIDSRTGHVVIMDDASE